MSSKGYATPLRLEVGANPLLQRLYLLLALSAVIVLFILPLPFVAKLLSAALLLYLTWRSWHRRTELGGSPVQIVWDGENQWWWIDGEEYAAELLGDSYLSPLLVVLNFRIKASHQTHALVLTPAALGDEQFRRMMVRFQITPKESSQG